MAEINLIVPEQLRHVKHLNELLIELNKQREEFESYVTTLNINVKFIISDSTEEQVVNTLTVDNENLKIFTLTVPLKRYTIAPGKLTPLPTPKELYDSVIFALQAALRNLSEEK
ncbi:hypothetical protein [Flavobacterium sp.]